MMSYTALAGKYDILTRDVDYASWARFYGKLFSLYGVAVASVLDLGCGTGSLTKLMAESGYEMIGVDASEDMLAAAAQKAYAIEKGVRPLLLRQKMEELDLYGTVDAAVSSLDCVNYITDSAALKKTLDRLRLFVRPGGLFIFDINTPFKLKGLDGQVFLDETEDVFCVWRAAYSEKTALCSYGMNIFYRRGGLWERYDEEHFERAYTVEELKGYLADAGFGDIRVFGDRRLEAPLAGEERVFIAAVRE